MFTAQQAADLESLLAAWRKHPDTLDMETLHAGVAQIAEPATAMAWSWFEGRMKGQNVVSYRFIVARNTTLTSVTAAAASLESPRIGCPWPTP
jgi:hypothetical protein